MGISAISKQDQTFEYDTKLLNCHRSTQQYRGFPASIASSYFYFAHVVLRVCYSAVGPGHCVTLGLICASFLSESKSGIKLVASGKGVVTQGAHAHGGSIVMQESLVR